MGKYDPAIALQQKASRHGSTELVHKVSCASKKSSINRSPFRWVHVTKVAREYVTRMDLAKLEGRLSEASELGYLEKARNFYRLTPQGHTLINPDGFSSENRRVSDKDRRYHSQIGYFGSLNY